MENSQIFGFGLSIIFGVLMFIQFYRFSKQSIFKLHLLLIVLATLGLMLIVSFDVYILDYTLNEAISGRILLMHFTPYMACYAIIIFSSLSIVSDAIYPLISILIEKIKSNKQKRKFRTPKIK